MRKLIGALTVAGLLVACANAQPGARIYFDEAGSVPGNQAEGDAPHPGVTAKINPSLFGGGRLYIYWEFGGANQNVFSPNYDIEIDGGTITNAAVILAEQGVTEVYCCVTHPVLSSDGAENLAKSNFKEVVVTDTIPLPPEKLNGKITVLSVAPMLGEAIYRIHKGLSVGEMFN